VCDTVLYLGFLMGRYWAALFWSPNGDPRVQMKIYPKPAMFWVSEPEKPWAKNCTRNRNRRTRNSQISAPKPPRYHPYSHCFCLPFLSLSHGFSLSFPLRPWQAGLPLLLHPQDQTRRTPPTHGDPCRGGSRRCTSPYSRADPWRGGIAQGPSPPCSGLRHGCKRYVPSHG
jgi:hypothetical protein